MSDSKTEAVQLFDEQALLLEIIRIWGAYGAHAEVMRDILAATSKSQERIRELEEALRGLMKAEHRGRVMPVGREWDAARAALKE